MWAVEVLDVSSLDNSSVPLRQTPSNMISSATVSIKPVRVTRETLLVASCDCHVIWHKYCTAQVGQIGGPENQQRTCWHAEGLLAC